MHYFRSKSSVHQVTEENTGICL